MPRAIALALCAYVTASLVPAQTTATLTPTQTEQLSAIADQVKDALAKGDLRAAEKLSTDLNLGIFRVVKAARPTSQEQLQTLEAAPPASGLALYNSLPRLAIAAFNAGDYDKAEQSARELLTLSANSLPSGLGVFYGNMILGRVALRRDKDIGSAKAFLLASGAGSGSPTLNSFGPNMGLAKDLIEAGERDVVLEYFALCRNFWKSKSGQQKLADWTAMVKGGGMPDFGANLVYGS